MTETIQLFIDGERVDAADGETFATENPANTSETVAEYAYGGEEDAERAVAAANEAQDGWESTPEPSRTRQVTPAATAGWGRIEPDCPGDRTDSVELALTVEVGQPR